MFVMIEHTLNSLFFSASGPGLMYTWEIGAYLSDVHQKQRIGSLFVSSAHTD